MARYIKANPLVAKHLHLDEIRNTTKDGNYLLWQADMLAFGPLPRLSETLAEIGAIALMPHEAKEEQDGTVTRPLPTAYDSRFVMPAPVEVPATEQAAPADTDAPEVDPPLEHSGDTENDTTETENPDNDTDK